MMKFRKNANARISPRLRNRLTTVLAGTVVFCTTYALILPAITIEQDVANTEPGFYLEDEKGKITILSIGKPLFYPEDSALVQSLYRAYVEVTGDTENKPMVIGGGTYAKALKNIIAFGPEMPGVDYRIHNADEFITIQDLQKSTEIYYRALQNMVRQGAEA